mgnify:FL=1
MVLTMEGKEVTYDQEKHSYEALREKTLNNLLAVYHSLKDIKDFSSLTIILNRNGEKMTFPFWNMINGPISDAIWHSGQVVANRRASGNPLNSKVNVFVGKTIP